MAQPKPKGIRVGLSAALPEHDRLAEVGLTKEPFLKAVDQICDGILADRGRILHGNHPSIVPTLAKVARRHVQGRAERPVVLVVGRTFFKTPEEYQAYAESQADYAEVVGIGDVGWEPARTLAELRGLLAVRIDALVCLGGKTQTAIGGRPGVEVEVEQTLQESRTREASGRPPIPIYLLGVLGGATRDLALRSYNRDPMPLCNGLGAYDNRILSEGPWNEAIALLLEDLFRGTR